jgi:hypothetical protein
MICLLLMAARKYLGRRASLGLAGKMGAMSASAQAPGTWSPTVSTLEPSAVCRFNVAVDAHR